MSNVTQEIAGIRNVLSQIAKKVNTNSASLTGSQLRMPYLAVQPLPDLPYVELGTLKNLIRDLSFRTTGIEVPEASIWQDWDDYVARCQQNSLMIEGRRPFSNLDCLLAFNSWIEKTSAYLDYLEGYAEAAGALSGKAPSGVTYDVALSFSGEDRKYAKELAALLRKDGFRVFYDEYEQATLWGIDLYTHLSEVYKNKARFCVMFISESYACRLWTNHERKSAQSRAFNESNAYILPVRIDDTAIPGVLETIGYLDLRKLSIEEVYAILREKLTQ